MHKETLLIIGRLSKFCCVFQTWCQPAARWSYWFHPFTIGQNYLEAHENLLVLNIRIADLDNWLIGLLFLHFPFLWKERFVWGIGPYWAVWFCRCNTLYYWRKDCISNWFHRMRNPSIQIVQTKRIYTQEYYVVSTAVCTPCWSPRRQASLFILFLGST